MAMNVTNPISKTSLRWRLFTFHSPPVADSRHCFRRHRCQPRLLHVVRQVVYVVNAVDDNVIAHVIHFVLTFQGHCDVFATAGTRSRLTNSGLYDEPACGNTCAPPFFYSSFLLLFFSSSPPAPLAPTPNCAYVSMTRLQL
jgi:hypothetical protein